MVSLFAMCLFVITLGAAKSPEASYTIDTPYEYPILPGTQEWIDLGDVVSRRESCQIPEDILHNMTADALLETVINYPFMADMYAFDDFQTGYETVKRRFNGLQELANRPDFSDILLSSYSESYASNNTEDDDEIWRDLVIRGLYYGFSKEFTLPASTYAGRDTVVYTPKGNPVYAIQGMQFGNHILPGTTKSEIDSLTERYRKAYPSLVLLRDTNSPNLPSYNCISYALYDQTTNNDKWLRNYKSSQGDGSWKYFTDGSYQKVTYPYRNAMVGDVFVYGGGENEPNVGPWHVALVNSIIPENGVEKVVSKWGVGCLWRHKPNDCPYWEEMDGIWSIYRRSFN